MVGCQLSHLFHVETGQWVWLMTIFKYLRIYPCERGISLVLVSKKTDQDQGYRETHFRSMCERLSNNSHKARICEALPKPSPAPGTAKV